MGRTDVLDPKALRAATDKYFGGFPGELICALQLWYEGLGGQGVPNAAEMTAVRDAIAGTPGWKDVGDIRFEKFGVQQTWKRSMTAAERNEANAVEKKMIQHIFKRECLYKEPDGTVLKVVTSEMWNLRCFKIVDGKMTGGMIKIHPDSDRAKALVEM